MRRNLLPLEREEDLHETGDPGRPLEMPDVRLHRADEEGARRLSPRREEGAERPHLDRVPEGRPGPVGLDVVDVRRREAGRLEGRADHRLLRRAVRRRQAAGAAVVADRGPLHDPDDPVAIAQRVREPPEDDDTASLSSHEAVGVGVEGPAPPLGRGDPDGREGEAREGRDDQVHPSREGEVALPRPEALARAVERHERRGAGGVDHEARAAKPEEVGEAPRDDADRVPRREGRIDRPPPGPLQPELEIVVVADADEDARAAPRQSRRGVPGVLQRLPRHLEEEPLLRVHHLGLAARDAEEAGVEEVDARQESAPRARLPGPIRPASGELLDGAAPGRLLDDPVDAGAERLPESVRPVASAGEATADADDGDRLARGAGSPPEPLHLPPHLAKLRESAAEDLERGGRRIAHASPLAFISSIAASSPKRSAASSSAEASSSGGAPTGAPTPSPRRAESCGTSRSR